MDLDLNYPNIYAPTLNPEYSPFDDGPFDTPRTSDKTGLMNIENEQNESNVIENSSPYTNPVTAPIEESPFEEVGQDSPFREEVSSPEQPQPSPTPPSDPTLQVTTEPPIEEQKSKKRIHFSSLFVPYQGDIETIEETPSKANQRQTVVYSPQQIQNSLEQQESSQYKSQVNRQSLPSSIDSTKIFGRGLEDPFIQNAVNQMIQFETDYLNNLGTILKNYQTIYNKFLQKSKKSLNNQEKNVMEFIFSNIEIISNFHTQILAGLKNCKEGNEWLGEWMKSTAPMFRVYTDYMTNGTGTLESLRKMRKIKDFVKFLEESKLKSGNNMEIEQLLMLPNDVLTRYDSFIKSLVGRLSVDHPDYTSLKTALSELNKVGEHIFYSKSAQENRNKIVAIQSKVVGIPNGLNLVAPHRRFLKESTLQMRSSQSKKGKINNVNIYAMNDMMLVVREKGIMGKQLICKHVISYHDATLEEFAGDRPGFTLKLSGGNTFTFFVSDEQVLNVWMELLNDALKSLKNSRKTTLIDVNDVELQTKLQVEVTTARDVIPCIFDPPDLYITMSIGGQIKKTPILNKCQFSPNWNEKFLFDLRNQYIENLFIEVKDSRGEKLLASTTVPLADLFENVEKKNWIELRKAIKDLQHPELLLGLTLGESLKESVSA